MAIRNAVPGDLDDLVALERRFPSDRISRRSFRRIVRPDTGLGSFVLVATLVDDERTTKQGVIVGNAVVHRRAGTTVGRVHSLVVRHDVEGRGIARALLASVARRLEAQGCTRVRLTVRAGDARARSLYERIGYRVRSVRPGYYGDGEDGTEMEATLTRRVTDG